MFNIFLAIAEIESDDERELVMRLFDEYSPRVKKLALKIMKNDADAEDALGNTFMRVIRYRHKFIGLDSLGTTKLIILYTKCSCFDMKRKKERSLVDSISNVTEDDEGRASDWDIPDDMNVLQDLLHREAVGKLQNAIETLKSPAREIVLLKYFNNAPNTEIAHLIGMNPSTVSTILQRSLKKLRRELEEYMQYD